MIQCRLAWPLHKDDMKMCEAVHILEAVGWQAKATIHEDYNLIYKIVSHSGKD